MDYKTGQFLAKPQISPFERFCDPLDGSGLVPEHDAGTQLPTQIWLKRFRAK
jgi:hypothetical protein